MWKYLIPIPVINTIESFVDSYRDQVEPVIGSVLYCDLAFGYMEHSGVYIGNNKIVHLNGGGEIEAVSPKGFIDCGTAVSIYVSCRDTNPVGSKQAAKRAKSMIGHSQNYNFILDNCHQFSSGCLSGDFKNAHSFLWMLKDETSKRTEANTWRVWDIELFD